jgi:hypothetical protein
MSSALFERKPPVLALSQQAFGVPLGWDSKNQMRAKT